MRTWLRISTETVLLKWDDEQLNDIIHNMFLPWRYEDCSPTYEVIIKRSGKGYSLQAPDVDTLCLDKETLVTNLEYTLTLLSQKIFDTYIQIHASCVDFNGNGVLFLGSHGSGKTTLALTAISNGFKALTDDITVLCEDHQSVIGFPRPFKVTDNTWNMYPRIVPEDCPYYKFSEDNTYVFFYIPQGSYYADETRLKHIVFPVRRKGPADIRQMGETEALRKILVQGMNFYLKEDGCVNDVLKLLRTAPPLEIAFSDHWDAISKLRDILL